MPVVRLIDQINAEVGMMLEARARPDDLVEYDAAVVTHEEDCPEGDHTHRQVMLGLWVALDCPETKAKSTSYVAVPLKALAIDRSLLDYTVSSMWDNLVLNRVGHNSGMEVPTIGTCESDGDHLS